MVSRARAFSDLLDADPLASAAEVRAMSAANKLITPASFGSRARFMAKRTTNQTGIADATPTKLTFDTEVFDRGACYDAATNYRWTPPAGDVALSLLATMSGTFSAGAVAYAAIYKNGSEVVRGGPVYGYSAGLTWSLVPVFFDVANGTDYYEAFGYIDVSSGTGALESLSGSALRSWFAGWQP